MVTNEILESIQMLIIELDIIRNGTRSVHVQKQLSNSIEYLIEKREELRSLSTKQPPKAPTLLGDIINFTPKGLPQ